MQEQIKSLEKIGLIHCGDAGYNRQRFEKDHAVFMIYEPDMEYISQMIEGTCPSDWSIERREQNIAHELTKSAVFLVGEIKINLKDMVS